MRFRTDPARHLRGSITPLVTPFTADGELDVRGLRGLVRWQLREGTHGVSIGGSTGEPSAQSFEERVRAMRVVAQETADAVPFVPGTGSADLAKTIALTGAAAELGADAVLVITPYYSRPSQEGLRRWYAAVAREYPDLPIILYNVPSRTAVDLAPQTVARLRAECPNIVGVKETTRDFEHVSRVLHTAGRDTLVWSGIELLCLPLLVLGGVGFVSAVANIAPAAVAGMYEAATTGDPERALDLHFALHPLVDVVFTEPNPVPVKWVLERAGVLPSGAVRPPLAPLSEAGMRRIAELLHAGRSALGPELAAFADRMTHPDPVPG